MYTYLRTLILVLALSGLTVPALASDEESPLEKLAPYSAYFPLQDQHTRVSYHEEANPGENVSFRFIQAGDDLMVFGTFFGYAGTSEPFPVWFTFQGLRNQSFTAGCPWSGVWCYKFGVYYHPEQGDTPYQVGTLYLEPRGNAGVRMRWYLHVPEFSIRRGPNLDPIGNLDAVGICRLPPGGPPIGFGPYTPSAGEWCHDLDVIGSEVE